jgi:hypothetical protein
MVVTGIIGGVIGGAANGVSAWLDGKPVGQAILIGAAAGAVAGFTLNPVAGTIVVSALTEAGNIAVDPCRELFSLAGARDLGIAAGAGIVGGSVGKAVGARLVAGRRGVQVLRGAVNRPVANRGRSGFANAVEQRVFRMQQERALRRIDATGKYIGVPVSKTISRKLKKAGKGYFAGDESPCPCQ